MFVVWLAQAGSADLSEQTFRTVVVVSLIPAVLAVISLAFGAKDVTVKGQRAAPKFAFRALGRPFMIFMVIVGIFTLGNSSDAFLVLRAQDLGVNVIGILAMVATFNLIYALISTPAGSLSDRIGRRKLIVGGWLVYALIYLGFGLAQTGWQVWVLYALYGGYYGMAYGTANALVADLVPAELRGTAYGSYNAIIGLLAFPASVIAGVLWQGVGAWSGFGPSAPFIFGGTLALIAAGLMAFWMPRMKKHSTTDPQADKRIETDTVRAMVRFSPMSAYKSVEDPRVDGLLDAENECSTGHRLTGIFRCYNHPHEHRNLALLFIAVENHRHAVCDSARVHLAVVHPAGPAQRLHGLSALLPCGPAV